MNRFKQATIRIFDRVLPAAVKNSIFHLSFHLARREFEVFAHKYGYAPNMYLGLSEIAGRGFSPRTIVDVGAFEGDWSKMARQMWPASRLFMVEPNREKEKLLEGIAKDLDATMIWELLGAENNREAAFHVMGSGSSVMQEYSAVPRTVETRRLRTLDSLLGEVESPALLKIDAQGYELEILKGASRLLPSFKAILLEVAIIEINAGAPLLHETVAFMKTRGFVVYDILEIHRRPLDGALNQIDLMFIDEQSALIADKRHY